MTLNCLTCQSLQRTNSDKEYGNGGPIKKLCCIKVERSWSGNLTPPPYEQIRNGAHGSMVVTAKKKVKKNHRRLNSTGAVAFTTNTEPKLVRSVGMRRDWSFEDLRQRNNETRKGARLT